MYQFNKFGNFRFRIHIRIFGCDFTVDGDLKVTAGYIFLTGIITPLHLCQQDIVPAADLYLWSQGHECNQAVLAVGQHLALTVVVIFALFGYGEFQEIRYRPSDNGIGMAFLLCHGLLLADKTVVLSGLVGQAGL